MAKTNVLKKSTKITSKTPKPSTRAIKLCSCHKDKEGKPLVIRKFTTDVHQGEACEECFLIINFTKIEHESSKDTTELVGKIPEGTTSNNEDF